MDWKQNTPSTFSKVLCGCTIIISTQRSMLLGLQFSSISKYDAQISDTYLYFIYNSLSFGPKTWKVLVPEHVTISNNNSQIWVELLTKCKLKASKPLTSCTVDRLSPRATSQNQTFPYSLHCSKPPTQQIWSEFNAYTSSKKQLLNGSEGSGPVYNRSVAC